MAEVTKVTTLISPGTLSPPPCNQMTRKVGATITPGDFVYLMSTGLWGLASGAAANAAAQWVGIAIEGRAVGSPLALTVMWGLEVPYAASGLVIGTPLYLSATVPGGLSTTATTGGDVPCAWVTGPDTIFVRHRVK
jgi:hypothetical protein